MRVRSGRRLQLDVTIERWPLRAPFNIAHHRFEAMSHVLVSLMTEHAIGRGEAAGVYYRGDTPETIVQQIEALRPAIESGELDRTSLQEALPPCGARNALDCAFWDLEARISGEPVWKVAGIGVPRPLLTTFTCSAEHPESVAAIARGFPQAQAIKLKLVGDTDDAARVWAVRAALPNVWLGIDANQAFTREELEKLLPAFLAARVEMIEQPLPIGHEPLLEGFPRDIPIVADESIQGLNDLIRVARYFDGVNIKLDKCGGLTEALAMARAARMLGLKVMVGNMMGTSLATAPAWMLGQVCDIVDLDGPIFLQTDRAQPAVYADGLVDCPTELWGSG